MSDVFISYSRRDSDFVKRLTNALAKSSRDVWGIQLHTRLLVRALEWDRAGRRPSFLLAGDTIDDAERWLAEAEGKNPPADPMHRTYITASREKDTLDRQRRRRLNRARTGFAAAGLALVFSVGAALFGVNAAREGEVARNDAATSAAVAPPHLCIAHSFRGDATISDAAGDRRE